MAWTLGVLGLVLVALGIFGWLARREGGGVPSKRAAPAAERVAGPVLSGLHQRARALVGGGLLLLAIAFLSTFIIIVPAGNVGVVMWFGRVEERTLPAGLHFLVPIAEHLELVDVRVQPHTFQEIDAASKEYQSVKLTGTMNYHIDPAQAYDLYRTVGLDFAEKVIDPAFNDFIKEVVPRYPVTEILAKRNEIRKLAKEMLGENLARYHIIMDDIYLANIRFGAEYERAIELKQVAEQQVQTEKQILEQRRVQAEQRVAEAKGDAQANIERAKGDAEATIARAEGQAQANERLSQSLSENVLTYAYIQKLGDKVQVMLVPSGQQFLLDTKGLLQPPGQ